MVNKLFILIIIGVAIAAIVFELMAIAHYWHSQCGPTAKAIKIIKQYLRSGDNGLNLDDNMRGWFLRHFDGEMRGNLFFTKQEGGSFVMLSYPTVLGKPVPRGPVYFAPTLLTALGVLGTFAGIYMGLQGVNLDAIQETDTLLKTSTELLAGMKVAFSTSLWGLGSSSVFMLFLAVGERVRQWRRNSLRQKLSQVAFLLTPGRILSRMDTNATRETAEQLREVANRMAGLSTLNADEIGTSVATAMRSVLRSELSPIITPLTHLTPEAIGQATAAELNPAFNSMQGELSNIRELQEKHGQAVDYLVTRLREELIEPVVKRLDETAKLTKEASEAVKELKTALGDITISLSGAVETIRDFQEDTLRDLKQFAEDLKDILDRFSQDTNGVLEDVGQKIKEAVDASTEVMEAQRKAFEQSAKNAAATFVGIREELEKSLRVQAERQKEMLEDAKQIFTSQSETLVTIGREAAKVMNDAATNLDETLKNVDEMLQNTRITVQDELENFRDEYQKSLTKFFKDQNNLLEGTLGKQREALKEVIEELQKVFLEDAPKMGDAIKEAMAEMQATLNSIQDTAKIVYNLANKTGLTSGERLQQLQEIIRELGSEANQIEGAYQDMVKKFDEALKIGNEQLMEYLEKANEAYTSRLDRTDSAIAEFCQQLNQTSHGLMDVSHYLVASANELKNGNGSRN